MHKILIVLLLAGGLSAADRLLIPIDSQQYQQLRESIVKSVQDGDNAALLRDGRRALELAPNDPEMQAPVYVLMSMAARNSGEVERAEDYAAAARALDPSIESRMKSQRKKIVTRGDTNATINNAVAVAGVFGQIWGSIEQRRTMKMCLDVQKHGMKPPPICYGQGPGQTGQVLQAPGGGQVLQPPVQTGQVLQPPGQVLQPPDQVILQPPVQTGATVIFPPTPVSSPDYQPPAAPPTPWPGSTAPQPQPVPTPVVTASTPPIPLPGRTLPPTRQPPYAVARNIPRNVRTRGGSETVFKVIHDHSSIGDSTYFAESCGGLLVVSGSNLTFTPSGGEAPVVIPAGEILEIGVNNLIGKDAGLFHIATRQGLYISLASESQDREQARSLVEAIRSDLGLTK